MSTQLLRINRILSSVVVLSALLFSSGCGDFRKQVFEHKQIGCKTLQYASRDGLVRPIHDNSDGIALTPDGNFAVLTADGSPSNQIQIVNLRSLTGLKISHPDPRVTLDDPAFSPDGKTLAIVASKDGLHGVAKILILSLEGDALKIIGDPDRGYRLPSFSPDGNRLAYWRDVSPTVVPGAVLKPEDRQLQPWGMFEFNLAAKKEDPLFDKIYRIPCGVFYDTQSDGFYYCALDLLKPTISADGRVWWSATDDAFEYSERLRGARTFYFMRSHSILGKPEPFLPTEEPLANMAAVRGVGADGSILLVSAIADLASEARFSSAAVWSRKGTFNVIFQLKGVPIADPVASIDTTKIFAKSEVLDKQACRLLTEYYLLKNGQIVKKFSLPDIVFETSVQLQMGG